jgi:hypothetical protein
LQSLSDLKQTATTTLTTTVPLRKDKNGFRRMALVRRLPVASQFGEKLNTFILRSIGSVIDFQVTQGWAEEDEGEEEEDGKATTTRTKDSSQPTGNNNFLCSFSLLLLLVVVVVVIVLSFLVSFCVFVFSSDLFVAPSQFLPNSFC